MRQKIRSAAKQQEPENSFCGVNESQQHAEWKSVYAWRNELGNEAEVKHAHLWVQDVGQETTNEPTGTTLPIHY